MAGADVGRTTIEKAAKILADAMPTEYPSKRVGRDTEQHGLYPELAG